MFNGIISVVQNFLSWYTSEQYSYRILIDSTKKMRRGKCYSVGEWVNKWWSIHTARCYSATERKELLGHTTTWMNPKWITLSENSQSQKVTYHIIPFIEHSWNDKILEKENLVMGQGRLRRRWGHRKVSVAIPGKHQGSFGDGNVLYLFSYPCPYLVCHKILPFCKMLQMGETG